MDKLLEILQGQRKEVLQYLVLKLMESGSISFAEIAELHVQYLEKLKKAEKEELMTLRGKVISTWCDYKNQVGKHLVSLMQEAKDKGWANISQEQIDNSKWNR